MTYFASTWEEEAVGNHYVKCRKSSWIEEDVKDYGLPFHFFNIKSCEPPGIVNVAENSPSDPTQERVECTPS